MEFPTKQADIEDFAVRMMYGVWNHQDDFPNVNFPALLNSLNLYRDSRNNQLKAKANLRLSTKIKQNSFLNLTNIMKSCLKKSIVDTGDNPSKMTLIGWGPKANSHPKPAPGPPRDLIAEKKDNRLYLFWRRPASDIVIKCYIIEKRVQSEVNHIFGTWHITGTSLDTNIELKVQQKAIIVEYRVIAVNSAGKSTPSNTVNMSL